MNEAAFLLGEPAVVIGDDPIHGFAVAGDAAAAGIGFRIRYRRGRQQGGEVVPVIAVFGKLAPDGRRRRNDLSVLVGETASLMRSPAYGWAPMIT